MEAVGINSGAGTVPVLSVYFSQTHRPIQSAFPSGNRMKKKSP